ncbi:MAG: UPF0182 family protein [Xenococcaceae cyanobacterium MO_188.B19]|nr:UPF0182 family protein [Xenococcaceae cyanobacterium MO_188.B19]
MKIKPLAINFLRLFAIVLILLVVTRIAAIFIIEILWFKEVNYLSILIKKWQTQATLFIIVFSISSLYLWVNLYIANRWQWRWFRLKGLIRNTIPYLKKSDLKRNNDKYDNTLGKTYIYNYKLKEQTLNKYNSRIIQLSLLLFLVFACCLSLALIVLYYAYLVFDSWQIESSLFGSFPKILSNFKGIYPINVTEYLQNHIREVFFIGFLTGIIIFSKRFGLTVATIMCSVLFSLLVASNWSSVLQFYHPTAFDYYDPEFANNIDFYIFIFPILEIIFLWVNGLFTTSFIIIFLTYLLSGNSLSEGRFPGFSITQIRHLFFLSGMVMLSVGLYHWLNRYNILYSTRGVVYGAGFADIKIQLPVEFTLAFTATAIALWLLFKSLTGYKLLHKKIVSRRKIALFLLPLIIYFSLLFYGNLGSWIVQRFSVQPNELAKEKTYLERNIEMTRQAFGLDLIEAKIFNPKNQLTIADIKNNDLTIDNIRLWDTRPILATNRQLQQIRPYYKFLDADIDRYILGETDENQEKQQVIIAARELDYNLVPNRAKTWVNKHLVYTHGYGFTLSPVTTVSEGGLPYYYVKDIGTGNEETGNLNVSSPTIRNSIPIGKPRIYYGELTNNYVMTSTKVKELDFPSGDTNIYNTYKGDGGIKLSNYGLRFLFANYLQDLQIIFTQNFTSETKILIRRNLLERVSNIAPFLRYDRDPYLVVAETEGETEHHLYWILDAYTTSNYYPYSDPGDNDFNYIRNSVKVVIDAYDGDVNFYIADAEDPILTTWSKVFPQLFQPLSQMPTNLRRHIRYPEDLFSIQSERLLGYHMRDPQVFYNREDQWQIPQEIYGSESRTVEPYYLIMKLPTEKKEEFILLHPYTPISRPNLIAWLAARSDGSEYGKLLLYNFPKQKLVYGPNQIEALINQDPVISQQITLWNREGSRVIQGNLLVIPIEESLLYVEPLYIEAEKNSLPTLARVILVYENKIIMAETLQKAIDAIFTPQKNNDTAIVRPVEEL